MIYFKAKSAYLPAMKSLGRHILVEFSNCNAQVLNDASIVEEAMTHAAKIAGATVINSTFHHFSPWGISGVVVIQESHLAIHTWPEYKYAAVDLFTCGESVDPWVCFEHLKQVFQANYSAMELLRGSMKLIKRSDFVPVATRHEPSVVHDPHVERSIWFTDKDENQALSLRYNGEVLFNEMSDYQQVRVFETHAYGKMLAINNMIMCTERDEFHYHEMITHPIMQLHGNAKDILVIGGGDGGTIREVFKYDDVKSVTMVEIDEAVIRASKLHLPKIASEFENAKLNLIVGDGIGFAKKAKPGSYDVIIVDGSDPVGPAKGLFTEEFYTDCKNALREGGILITQGESPMFHEDTFMELNKCLKNIFGQDQTHTLLFHATTYPSGMWSLQMGIKGSTHPVRNFNADRARQFCRAKNLRYYNHELHTAAFSLPTFVRNMLGESV
jgi:spermidine synthase